MIKKNLFIKIQLNPNWLIGDAPGTNLDMLSIESLNLSNLKKDISTVNKQIREVRK